MPPADNPALIPSLASYALLGRSGLRVSPLCLGTMTFGTEWGWGADEATSFAILDRYVAAGGNFLDTADLYTKGSSERIVGRWMKERAARDKVVLATKFTFGSTLGDPNSGGNGRKNIHRSLTGSLERLGTDHVDLYWLHGYDGVTRVEEVMRTLDDLVRAGLVRAVGFSDVPAWYAARAQTLAELRGWEPLAAMQLEYSLVERNIEREHVPLALELDIGITPWSPLAAGLLTGKHKRGSGDAKVDGGGRLKAVESSPQHQKLFTERNWRIVDVLREVSAELQRPMAQVALAFIARRRGVTSTIIGATGVAQLEENLRALELELPPALAARLEEAGRPELVHPYNFFVPGSRGLAAAGVPVRREPPWFRG